jgi:hypothetical protein
MEGRSPERRAQVGDTVAIDGSFDPVERRSPARCTQTAAAQTAATRKQQRKGARPKVVRPQGARVLAATVPPLVENPALPWFLPCSLPWSKTRGRPARRNVAKLEKCYEAGLGPIMRVRGDGRNSENIEKMFPDSQGFDAPAAGVTLRKVARKKRFPVA